MRARLFATISIMALAAACQAPPDRNTPRYAAPEANRAAYMSSEQACADYGFTAGSAAYDRCVMSERSARSSGRVSRDYTETQLTGDARSTCSSYGLQPGSVGYDRCVNREIEARRYREGTTQPSYATYRTDQYGNRYDAEGYRVDANGYRLSPQPSYQAPTYPTYRTDQYGYRIDSEGYRVDANGYRLSPQPSYAAPSAPVTNGHAVFHDEFGFRYDAQGNRLDRNGRIISPQSTTP